MKKITIGDRSFPTTHHGHLVAGETYSLPDHFADYCVLKMRSAIYCKKRSAPKNEAMTGSGDTVAPDRKK